MGLDVQDDRIEDHHAHQLPRLLREGDQDGHRSAERGAYHRDQLPDPGDDAQKERIGDPQEGEAQSHGDRDG